MESETRVTEYFKDALDKQKQFQNGKPALGGSLDWKASLGSGLDIAANSDKLWL